MTNLSDLVVAPSELHRIGDRRILRYDLTLPCEDSMHLQAFHQAEAFWLDDRSALDPWRMAARVKIAPTHYPMCSEAWELEVEHEGQWSEVLAWGVFSDKAVAHIGADPAATIAIGAGYGLERLAMLRYGIDDIRKVDMASVAWARAARTPTTSTYSR